MSEFDDLPSEERFRLRTEATLLVYGMRLKVLENLLAEALCVSPDDKPDTKAFHAEMQKRLDAELDHWARHLSDFDAARTSRLLRYIEMLERRKIGGNGSDS